MNAYVYRKNDKFIIDIIKNVISINDNIIQGDTIHKLGGLYDYIVTDETISSESVPDTIVDKREELLLSENEKLKKQINNLNTLLSQKDTEYNTQLETANQSIAELTQIVTSILTPS